MSSSPTPIWSFCYAKTMNVPAEKMSAFGVGDSDAMHVATSHVERQNLTTRMPMRRFTRPTNALSKKESRNHMHAISLHFMFYTFGRIHKSLRITPAMEGGVADHVWSLEEIAALSN